MNFHLLIAVYFLFLPGRVVAGAGVEPATFSLGLPSGLAPSARVGDTPSALLLSYGNLVRHSEPRCIEADKLPLLYPAIYKYFKELSKICAVIGCGPTQIQSYLILIIPTLGVNYLPCTAMDKHHKVTALKQVPF